jgi:restriction endonuclease S subunit
VHLLKNSSSIFTKNYKLAHFNEFTKKADIKKICIKDSEKYKILGVRTYGLGMFLNRKVFGSTLKMRIYQQVKINHLFWCKVDTKNGGFGIITDEFLDGVCSSNMTLAELDINKINTQYLQIFFKSKIFNNYMDNLVVGTTNRKYIKFNDLLNIVKIPLPSLEIQQQLVKNYQDKINLAKQQEVQYKQKEAEIEVYLYKELGIELPKKEQQNKDILQFISFKDLNHWQIIITNNFNCDYQMKIFNNICDFKNKRFDKNKYENLYFNYIDIGSIDPLKGITGTKKIKLENAPSRATQCINKGDLIIATTRPYLQKFAIVDDNFNNDVCSSGFSVIQSNPNKYNLFYIKEFLQSYYGIEQLKANMTGGLYPAITLKKLKEIKFPLPPLGEQNRMAEHIQNIKNEIQVLKQQAEQNKKNALNEFEAEIFTNKMNMENNNAT